MPVLMHWRQHSVPKHVVFRRPARELFGAWQVNRQGPVLPCNFERRGQPFRYLRGVAVGDNGCEKYPTFQRSLLQVSQAGIVTGEPSADFAWIVAS